MKRLVFLGLFICCLLSRADEEFHIFTDTMGRAISARIISYDVRNQAIRVQMENGRQGTIPLAQLSDADKEYVLSWNKFKDFMDDRRLKISVKRIAEDNEEKTRKHGIFTRDVENMGYEILLENKSDMAFENVTMQYCIFYEQEEGASGGNETMEGVYCGKKNLDKLLPGSKQELKTEMVLIYKAELDSGYIYSSGTDSSQDGEVHGIWVRLAMELPGGDKVVREFCLPDSIPNSHKWTTSSVNVGMN